MRSSRKLSLAANLYILSHRFQFVKNFFQVFSNFFPIRSLSCRSRDSFDIISLHPYFVNTFFKENYFYFEVLLRCSLIQGFTSLGCPFHIIVPWFAFCYAPLRREAFADTGCRIRRSYAGYSFRTFILDDRIG